MSLLYSLLSLKDEFARAYVQPDEIAALRSLAIHFMGTGEPVQWDVPQIVEYLFSGNDGENLNRLLRMDGAPAN